MQLILKLSPSFAQVGALAELGNKNEKVNRNILIKVSHCLCDLYFVSFRQSGWSDMSDFECSLKVAVTAMDSVNV